MTWNGYVEYDGTELINVARVEAYARHHSWFKPLFGNEVLGLMLGDKPYRSPLQDDAPWTDPDQKESYDFLGAYPLDISGLEDSSRTSDVTESLTDGGVPGRVRHATKSIVFSVALLADSDAGADYGMKWLRRALMGGVCGPTSPSDCFGATLCYLASEPEADLLEVPWGTTAADADGGAASGTGPTVADGGNAASSGAPDPDILGDPFLTGGDATSAVPLLTRTLSLFAVKTISGDDPVECLTPYLRSRYDVVFNNGPTITSKRTLSDGGAVWTVTFTGVAGIPWEFGPELEVIRGFLDPNVTVPWAGGVEPDGAAIDLDGYMLSDESECDQADPSPLYDPLHPALVLPPGVPSVPLGAFTPPVNWRRRQITIPKQYVPLWGEVVPRVQIHARDADLRNLRLRFYADPFLVGDISDDPCAFCGDMIVSYVPQGSTMILDGVDETVNVVSAGNVIQRADSLVFASDGRPFAWPKLSCGFGYIVTLDLEATAPPPVVDLSLVERII